MDLFGSTADAALAVERAGFWRCTWDITDQRAQVGRPFGDGSPKQGWRVIQAIIDTGTAWIDKVRVVYDDDDAEKKRPIKLRWELMRTLRAVLGFVKFSTGEIVATYEMIARAAGCCRLTAIRHMALLRRLKWIDWARRSEPAGEGQKRTWAPNAYFFEISRLPLEAQIHLRQILKRQGIELQSHPERRGSGPVPNRAQRLLQWVAKSFDRAADSLRGREQGRAVEDAAFVRREMERMGDLPTDQWAQACHPGDLAAQEAYNRRMGISFDESPSNKSAPDSHLAEQGKRTGDALGVSWRRSD
ncbi:hypothetical protein [Novosphingobium huizhouense]|uniref:hypothetical protein n=1 Tax=Novosphingobium huizhouense TaxID=2866625 RepID=UPI001CD86F9A|nr:hypothetical protein [Novosphingobium huizhouense]